jgi:hypothetical protein
MAGHGPDPMHSAPDDSARHDAADHVNQLAVAEVLARHLGRHPKRAVDGDLLPRQLKDTAAPALSGRLHRPAALGCALLARS